MADIAKNPIFKICVVGPLKFPKEVLKKISFTNFELCYFKADYTVSRVNLGGLSV